jgi:hypothetical protein
VNRAYQRRKVTPKVKNGIVQKKNRHQFTARLGYVIDRQSPTKGCRYVLTKQDLRDFISIIPDWHDLAVGLESIVLTSCGDDHDGRYEVFQHEKTGSIQIPAWEGDFWKSFTLEYFYAHQVVFQRIGLAFDQVEDGVQCRFTHRQAKAFLLLHIFLHELGHHVDRMQTKQQESTVRGEQCGTIRE